MRNEYILNSKIFLFTGAGASKPFGKWLMDEFIDHLIEQIHDSRIPPQGLHGLLDTIITYREKDLESILKEINDLTDKDDYLGDMTRVNCIHDVLDGEEIARKRVFIETGSPHGDFTPLSSPFSKKYDKLSKMCMQLRTEIQKMIYDHYGFVDKNKVVEVYDPLINTLVENIQGTKFLPIFTTNYDICFEEYGKATGSELIDGFYLTHPGREFIWKGETFDNFKPDKGEKYLILFKLHGSVTWYDDRGVVKYLGAPIHRPEGERIKNVIIYPAKNKIALNDPFFTGYDYFQRCLDHARIGIFIGYSFRDYDTVTKIKSGLKFNDALRILILDPNAPRIITTSFSDFQDQIIPLEFKFGLESDEQSYLKEISKHLQKT